MKTGKPTRLSEKLNAELDTIRQEHVASISYQLKTFRSDMKNIVEAAQHTIESDTRRFQTETATLYDTRLSGIRRWLRISPWAITGIIVMGIALIMAASFLWTVHLNRSELTELGLTRIDMEDGTWLVLDPTKTRLRTCTMGRGSVTCIKTVEN